jgi:hypothetical protein
MLAPARTQTGHELGRRCCPISLEDEVPEMWARPKGPAQMEEHGFQASFRGDGTNPSPTGTSRRTGSSLGARLAASSLSRAEYIPTL